MTYPILEFDPSPEAFVEPSKIIQARDLPENCVICFFQEVIEKVVAGHDASIVVAAPASASPDRSRRSITPSP